MNTPYAFTDILPHESCAPEDALEAIVDQLAWYSRNGYFSQPKFIEAFAQKISHILTQASDGESKKHIEIEIAHIFKYIREKHGIILGKSPEVASVLQVEKRGEDLGVWKQYEALSLWKMCEVSDFSFATSYLSYMLLYAHRSMHDCTRYLSTLIMLSQMGKKGVDAIFAHMESMTDDMEESEIQSLIDEQEYGVRDAYSKDDWREEIMECTGMSYEAAGDWIGNYQAQKARIFSFLQKLQDVYMSAWGRARDPIMVPYLNNIRDILDPEQDVPFYFLSSPEEMTIRHKYFCEKLSLH